MSFETKTEKVKEHLETNGNITTWEAIQNYGATRLSAIIFNLRKRGFNIISNWQYRIDRNGKKSRYVKYELDEEKMIRENENHIPGYWGGIEDENVLQN